MVDWTDQSGNSMDYRWLYQLRHQKAQFMMGSNWVGNGQLNTQDLCVSLNRPIRSHRTRSGGVCHVTDQSDCKDFSRAEGCHGFSHSQKSAFTRVRMQQARRSFCREIGMRNLQECFYGTVYGNESWKFKVATLALGEGGCWPYPY